VKLNETAALLRDKGEPVIHLGGGEPKSKTPIDAIVSCSGGAQHSGDVKYTPPDGIPLSRRPSSATPKSITAGPCGRKT
jgi:aspartate/methionine/tyrosine aminotransferase